MAIKGTPAQVARIIDTLANHWTNDQVREVYGGITHVEAHAARDESIFPSTTANRRGFHADSQGYKVTPAPRHAVGSHRDR